MTDHSYELSRAFGYLTEREVMALKQLVSMLPPNPVVVNIGAGAGTSGVAILERKDATLITIDIRQESPLGSLQSELNAIKGSNLGDVSARHIQILGDSKNEANGFEDIDMVFIDGDHSREGVRGDITTWFPLIKEGGIIAFDDYGAGKSGKETWIEVRRAVDELIVPNCEQVIFVDSVIGFRKEKN